MYIHSIIQSLSQEEKSKFKSYLLKRNKRSDTKNITLFKLLQTPDIPQDIDKQLYGKPARNAFHALSKRLYESLIDFIALQHIEKDITQEFNIRKFIINAITFYEREQNQLGKKTLQKAVRLATEIESFGSLREIYHLQIEHLDKHPEMIFEELVINIEQNQKSLAQQERLNLAYAYLKNQLKNQNISELPDLKGILTRAFQRFEINVDTSLNFKSLHTLLEIIHTAAHLEHSFSEVLPYIKKIDIQIQQKKSVSHKHLFHRIQFNYFMASAYFRVRQFEQSSYYLSQMKLALQEERGRYKSRFIESKLLIEALLANYTGNSAKAISLISEHITKTKKSPHPDLALALTMFQIQLEKPRNALTTVNKLIHRDSWYVEKSGQDWLIKKDLIELVIHIELENTDLVDSLFRRLKRKYKEIIKTQSRLQNFLKFAWIIYNEGKVVDQNRFRESIKENFWTNDQKNEDIFMLSFFAWIKARITNKPIYETTLELL